MGMHTHMPPIYQCILHHSDMETIHIHLFRYRNSRRRSLIDEITLKWNVSTHTSASKQMNDIPGAHWHVNCKPLASIHSPPLWQRSPLPAKRLKTYFIF